LTNPRLSCINERQKGGDKTPKVFQVFNLDLDRMKELGLDEKSGANLPRDGQELVRALKEKGYDVFAGSKRISGLSTSILVAKDMPAPKMKADFYSVLRKIKSLCVTLYRSGEAYLETAS